MSPYRLTRAAEDDLRDIWQYTHDTWALDQADRYFDRIEACCEAVGTGIARSKHFDELPDGVRIHRCEHHYIVWLADGPPIILAVLHERMDILRRLQDRLSPP